MFQPTANRRIKMMRHALILALASALLAACSAKVSSDSPEDIIPQGQGDSRELKWTTEPLSGSIDGQPWKMGKIVARKNSQGDLNITIAGEGINISCDNTFPMAPHISFYVPPTTGTYPYDGSAGGRLINVNFPYTTSNGGGSTNVLGSKSLIEISVVNATVVKGQMAALSPTSVTEHKYELSGSFETPICPENP